MEGQIKVPIFDDPLGYEAVIYPGDQYSFSVSIDSTVTAPLFLADVELKKESKIEIGKIDGEFVAKATLTGHLEIKSSRDENAPLQIGLTKLCFQDFEVSNQAPYFSPGVWGIVKDTSRATDFQPDAGGFGLRIDNILPYKPGDDKIGLGFDVGLIINEEFDIKAEGRLGIEGKLEEVNGRQRWIYDGIKISQLAVDASFPSTSIKGLVEWFDDTKENCVTTANTTCWGKGFRGALEAEFAKIGEGLKVQAVAQFGQLEDSYKYFYVDALVHPGKALSKASGFIQLKGFGGGVSYHMDINPGDVSFLSAAEDTTGTINLPDIGQSFSGSTYTPTDSIGLALKATAVIAAGKEQLFNGTISLAVLFNNGQGNGINRISLQGSGHMLQDIDLTILPDFVENALEAPPSVKGEISCYMDLSYNFNEPSFHGYLDVFLNAGQGKLRGSGPNNKLVNATIHFDPDKWFIHIGRPMQGSRAGALLAIPGLGATHLDFYLQAGTQTDPMPPIPSKVREIAHSINNNQSLRTSGAGFILGFSAGLELKGEIAGVVKSELSAEIGADIMLRTYNGVTCVDTGNSIGINNRYGVGQVYAYAYGRLEAFGVNIAEAGIAAALQFRGPNPCLLYTSPSPRDATLARMPSSA